MFVFSVFCSSWLFGCVLHSLCVRLEGHFALLHSPKFEWGPLFRVEHAILPLSTIYYIPPFPPFLRSPLFFE